MNNCQADDISSLEKIIKERDYMYELLKRFIETSYLVQRNTENYTSNIPSRQNIYCIAVDKYPELARQKWAREVGCSQKIGDFLNWLVGERGLSIAYVDGHNRVNGITPSMTVLLSEYFDIDLNKIELERLHILDNTNQ